MRTLLLCLTGLLIAGCSKKEIKLPILEVPGVHEIQNHSEVWMFLNVKEKDTSARVNRKNTISATHWIFNIDKRLPLKTICDHINELKAKHAGSVHSVEGMHNYFSYADTLANQLSLFEFDNITFNTENKQLKSREVIQEKESDSTLLNCNMIFTKNHFYFNDQQYEKGIFESIFPSLLKNSSLRLYLNFDENISYQDYLYYRTWINHLLPTGSSVHSIEYIIDTKS